MSGARGGRAGSILLVSLVVAYPLLVYFLLKHGSVRMAGLVLLLMLAVRLLGPGSSRGRNLAAIAAGSALAVAVLLTRSELLVRLYPVGVNLVLLGTFGLTLVRPPSMIERIAGIDGRQLDPQGIRYTRNVTRVWCGFFALNASIALLTATAGSREAWAIYNGFVSYVLVGALLVGERLVRASVLRSRGATPARQQPPAA